MKVYQVYQVYKNVKDKIDDEVDGYEMDGNNRYWLPQTLNSKHNIGEWVENNDYDECDYDGDSDTSSVDSPRSSSNKVPKAISKDTTRRKSRSGELPRTTPRTTSRVLRNEIKAMSGRKFTGTELITYGNKIEEKKTGMI